MTELGRDTNTCMTIMWVVMTPTSDLWYRIILAIIYSLQRATYIGHGCPGGGF